MKKLLTIIFVSLILVGCHARHSKPDFIETTITSKYIMEVPNGTSANIIKFGYGNLEIEVYGNAYASYNVGDSVTLIVMGRSYDTGWGPGYSIDKILGFSKLIEEPVIRPARYN